MDTRTSPAPSGLRASSLTLAASTAICTAADLDHEQFSGFASPEETNRRYHYLIEQSQTGLSVAFDLSNLTDAGQRILKL